VSSCLDPRPGQHVHAAPSPDGCDWRAGPYQITRAPFVGSRGGHGSTAVQQRSRRASVVHQGIPQTTLNTVAAVNVGRPTLLLRTAGRSFQPLSMTDDQQKPQTVTAGILLVGVAFGQLPLSDLLFPPAPAGVVTISGVDRSLQVVTSHSGRWA
jgi:hypothetical protein